MGWWDSAHVTAQQQHHHWILFMFFYISFKKMHQQNVYKTVSMPSFETTVGVGPFPKS
jgi:hypothetical protein